MPTPLGLLTDLAARGVTVSLAGDRLRCKGPMTPDLRNALAVCKADVMAILQAAEYLDPDPVDAARPCTDCGGFNYWFTLGGAPVCRFCCPPAGPQWENYERTERWCIQNENR